MQTMANAWSSWKTTIVGLLSAVVAVIQAANEPSLGAAFTDPKLQIPLLIAVLGFLSKDADKTGVAPPPPPAA